MAYPPFVSPDISRDFVYIDEVVKANTKCINKNINNQIYNISSCTTISNKEIMDLIIKNINPKYKDNLLKIAQTAGLLKNI